MSILHSNPYSNLTVMVVDDDSVHRKIVRRALEGYLKLNVIEAKGGKPALTMLREQIPDLILLDISMQDIDGDAVLNRIRRDVKTAHIPVIMCTADNQPETISRLLAMQISGYIIKPYHTIDVVEKAKAIFDKHLRPNS